MMLHERGLSRPSILDTDIHILGLHEPSALHGPPRI